MVAIILIITMLMILMMKPSVLHFSFQFMLNNSGKSSHTHGGAMVFLNQDLFKIIDIRTIHWTLDRVFEMRQQKQMPAQHQPFLPYCRPPLHVNFLQGDFFCLPLVGLASVSALPPVLQTTPSSKLSLSNTDYLTQSNPRHICGPLEEWCVQVVQLYMFQKQSKV